MSGYRPKVGDRVRRVGWWAESDWVEVLFVGRCKFFGRHPGGERKPDGLRDQVDTFHAVLPLFPGGNGTCLRAATAALPSRPVGNLGPLRF